MHYHKQLLLFQAIVIASLHLTSCASTQDATEAPRLTVEITEIVEKKSQRPIDNNVISVKRETPDGKLISTEEHINKSSLSITMPANGSVILTVVVEAPGYYRWGNTINLKLNSNKVLYIPVEMERRNGLQG